VGHAHHETARSRTRGGLWPTVRIVVILVLVLTIGGWLFTVGGVIAVLVSTPREVRAIAVQRDAIEARRAADVELAKRRLGGDTPELYAYAQERHDQKNRELRAAKIPPSSANLFAGPGIEPMVWTLERVAKSNIPNVVVALLGGTLSTLASVLSLFV